MALIPDKYQQADGLKTSDVLPAGEYTCALVAAARDCSEDGLRDWLNCQFRVQSGPCAGAAVFHRFYFKHEKQNTLTTSEVLWSKFLHAAGARQVVDSDELLGIEVAVKITVSPARDGYEASNWVRSFSPAAQSLPGGVDYDAPGTNLTGFAEPQP